MLLPEGSYKVVGKANNGDYMVRRAERTQFPLSPTVEVGLTITISGSSKDDFRVGEYVIFDEGLGRFTRNTNNANPGEVTVIAYYRKLSTYLVAIQSELSKNPKTNSVILYDPDFVDFFPLFGLITKTKEFDEIAGYTLRLLETERNGSNFFYEGPNGLSGGIFGGDLGSRLTMRDIDAILKREKFPQIDDDVLGKLQKVGRPTIVGINNFRTKFPWSKDGTEQKTLEFLVQSVTLN